MSQQWKSGLFGCFGDTSICLKGCICPCLVFGENAEKIDGSPKMKMCLCYAFLPCCGSCILHKPRRQKLREQHNIQEDPNDLLAALCCPGCAICQEARELQARGGAGSGARPAVVSQPGKK